MSEDEARGLVRQLFRDHSELVGRVCRRVLRDPEEAEDAAQQTFLSAHRSLLGGAEPREPAAWLCAIATNECRARIRKRMEDAPPTDLLDEATAGDMVELAGDRSELDAVRTALAELPPRQRASVLLRDFRGLSYEEVARVLDVSPPAVESLLFRARRTLRARVRGVATRARVALGFPFALRDCLGRLLSESEAAGAVGGGATPVAAKVAVFAAAGALGVVAVPESLHVPLSSPSKPAAPEHHAAPALVAAPQERTAPVGRASPDVEPTALPLHPRPALDRREARDPGRSPRSSVRERSRAAEPVVRSAPASPPVWEDWSPPGPAPPPSLPEPPEPAPALPEPLEPDTSPEPPGPLPESDDPDPEEAEASDAEPGDPEPDGEPRESEEADRPDELHPDSVGDGHASEHASRGEPEEAEEAEE